MIGRDFDPDVYELKKKLDNSFKFPTYVIGADLLTEEERIENRRASARKASAKLRAKKKAQRVSK